MTPDNDLRATIAGYDRVSLDQLKKQLRTRLTGMDEAGRQAVFSRIKDIPQLSDVYGEYQPSAKKVPLPITTPKPRGVKETYNPWAIPEDVPAWKKALSVVNKPFEIAQEYAINPIVQAASYAAWQGDARPELKRAIGEQGVRAFMPGGAADIAFEEWEEPVLWETAGGYKVRPTKGLLEMLPWFAIPPMGVAAKGTGIAGALTKQGIKQGGTLGKALKIAGKAIEYSPQGTMEKIPGAVFKAVRGAAPATPTMVGKILELPAAKELQDAVKKGVVSSKLLNMPGIRRTLGAIKFAATADDTIKAARVIKGQMQDMREAGIFAAVADARVKKVPIKTSLGEVTDTAIKQIADLPNGKKSMAIHDIVEYADRYDMPAKTRTYIEEIREVSKQLSAYAKKENLPIKQIVGEPDFVYLHRVVKEVRSEGMEAIAGGLEAQLRADGITTLGRATGEKADDYVLRVLGESSAGKVTLSDASDALIKEAADITDIKVTRQAVDKKRYYETVADGIKAGVTYADDPLQELQAQGRAIYDAVIQKRVGELLEPLGATKTSMIEKELGISLADLKLDKGAAQDLVHALNQGMVGKGIAGATLEALDRRYPGAANVVRGILQHVRENRADIQYAKTFVSAIKGARQVGAIPYSMVARIKNRFPRLGAEVERVMAIGMPEFDVAVKGISDDMWKSMKINRQEFLNALTSVRAVKANMPIAGGNLQNISMAEITEALTNINAANWQQKALLQRVYLDIWKASKQNKLDEIKALVPLAERHLADAQSALDVAVNDIKVNALDVAKTEVTRLTGISRKAAGIGAAIEGKVEAQKYGQVVGVPGISGRIIEPQIINGRLVEGKAIAEEIRKYFAWQPPTLLDRTMQRVGTVGGILRMGKLSFDMSAQFIQTLPMLGIDAYNLLTSPLYAVGIKQLPMFGFINKPSAYWAKGVAQGFKSFINPAKAEAAYWARAENRFFLIEAARYGALAEPSEIVEGYGSAMQWFKGKGKSGEVLQQAISNTYGRAEAAFTATRNVTANEYRKGMWEVAKAAGRLDDMVKGSNLLTGVLSTKGMGQTTLQRNFESGFAFMSPRMTRSNLAVLGNIVWNPRSWTGREAAKAITGLMVANATVFSGVSLALGQKPRLNPLPKSMGGDGGEWMTVKIGERYIGLGGIMNDIRALAGVVGEASDDPELVLTLDENNPIVQRLRQKLAPPTSFLFDYLKGRDYYANPIRGDSLMPTAETVLAIGKWGLPVFVESMINEGASLEGVMAEFFGARSFPESTWNQYKTALAGYAKKPYYKISDYEKNQLEKTHPDLVELKDISTREMERRGYDTVSAEYWNQRDVGFQERIDILEEAQRLYDKGELSGSQLRGVIQDTGKELGGYYQALEGNPRYQSVIADMKVRSANKTAEALDKGWVVDYGYNAYWRILFDPANETTLGTPNYDAIDAQMAQLRGELGENVWTVLQEWVKENQQRYPFVVREYYRAQETLKPYWAIENEVWADSPQMKQLSDQIQILESTDERKARLMLIQSGMAADILWRRKMVALKRKQMKVQNPAIAAYLKMYY